MQVIGGQGRSRRGIGRTFRARVSDDNRCVRIYARHEFLQNLSLRVIEHHRGFNGVA
jgi:hypothetical protein